MRAQLLARRREQSRAEADALIFRLEIEFVDLALLRKLAGAVAAERGIAHDVAANLDHKHVGGAPDRVLPPARAAATDHSGQRLVRDDAGIGAEPGSVMHPGDRVCVADVGPSDVDLERFHAAHSIVAAEPAAQAPPARWANSPARIVSTRRDR